jgi:hypothetical protein
VYCPLEEHGGSIWHVHLTPEFYVFYMRTKIVICHFKVKVDLSKKAKTRALGVYAQIRVPAPRSAYLDESRLYFPKFQGSIIIQQGETWKEKKKSRAAES